MSISAGLVGLPNVGKSTLFNALTKSSVPAENYPFCTIEPHTAFTAVPDIRLEKLKAIYNSNKIIPATVQFVDIAGLVKGASSGEGLGNQFLSHIKEVNVILHILRCFTDTDITRTEPVDPIGDYDIIITELILKDIEYVTKRIQKIEQLIKSNKNKTNQIKELQAELELLITLEPELNNVNIEKIHEITNGHKDKLSGLLSAKNFIIIANLSESEITNYKENIFYQQLAQKFGEERLVPISVKLEYELTKLEPEEQTEIMELIGLEKTGLDNIIEKSYKNLDLITFFTCGPKEIHAWPIKKGITIREAAGEIHSDLERGFICADIFNYHDIELYGSESKVKEAGKYRTEGQEYIVRDGDIVNIKFNV